MKIIKRDGRIVEYKREKIEKAILNANRDVIETDRVNKKQIDTIIKHIEELNKKRMLVEDIQDIIETELMKIKKYNLAKAYIIYRYNRALIRKSNNTDELIMNIIKNNQVNDKNNIIEIAKQRDLIASEVSKDLTKRVLLPEKISEAHENGILYFHNREYFLQPIFNSSIINYNDMFTNRTIINNVLIDTPTDFNEAINTLNNIITQVINNQYGDIIIETKYLGKYLALSDNKITNKKNKEKELNNELKNGIKNLFYHINSLLNIHDKQNITLFLELDTEYIKYNAKIIEEILNQKYIGMQNENEEFVNINNPKLIYVIDTNNNLNGNDYDYITRLSITCAKKTNSPNFISAKVMKEKYDNTIIPPLDNNQILCLYKNDDNKYQTSGRFNQGIVSINLPQIALEGEKNEEAFYNLLEERLELCYEALMCRHHALIGTSSDISPILWQNGAIARLNKNEKIDKLLKNGYSTLTLGYFGINEVIKILNEENFEKFTNKLLKYLQKKCDEWTKNTGVRFSLCSINDTSILKHFLEIDKEKYGIIKEITDQKYYSENNNYMKEINEEIIKNIYENILYYEIKENNNE